MVGADGPGLEEEQAGELSVLLAVLNPFTNPLLIQG
jgi:hypothetical protein